MHPHRGRIRDPLLALHSLIRPAMRPSSTLSGAYFSTSIPSATSSQQQAPATAVRGCGMICSPRPPRMSSPDTKVGCCASKGKRWKGSSLRMGMPGISVYGTRRQESRRLSTFEVYVTSPLVEAHTYVRLLVGGCSEAVVANVLRNSTARRLASSSKDGTVHAWFRVRVCSERLHCQRERDPVEPRRTYR